MEEGIALAGGERGDMGQKVHDEMSGYKEREKKIKELKDDYAKKVRVQSW